MKTCFLLILLSFIGGHLWAQGDKLERKMGRLVLREEQREERWALKLTRIEERIDKRKERKEERENREKKAGLGTRRYEAMRLPMHIFRLNTSKTKTLHVEKVPYSTDKRQYILVCESEQVPAYRKEVIFFLHGGGWHIGKPRQHLLLAEMLANEGYLVVLPAYRLAPEVNYEGMRADIDSALLQTLDWLRTEKGWEDRRIVVGGASAGGNLAALLVFDYESLQRIGLKPEIFAGFFSMAGVLDLESMPDGKILEEYAGKRESDMFCRANPLQHLDGRVKVPVLCIHGDKDGLVSHDVAKNFAQRLCQLHCELLDFHTIAGGTHLGAASQWYYKKNKNEGQGAIIINWLQKLAK